MLRLLHLADVHLGKTFTMLGEQGPAQRRALEAALVRVMDLAIQTPVQAVLIAGDLFDSPKPSPALVDLALRELRRLVDHSIWVAVAGGNHDVAPDGFIGASDRLRDAGPRLVLLGGTPATHRISELDLTIVGRSADPGAGASPLIGWPREHPTRFAVGVAHGSVFRPGVVEGPGSIHPQEIRDLNLDYLALGDWHSASEVTAKPAAWYAGSPELLAYDQEGAGFVLQVEITAPGAARVTPLRIGKRRYQRVEIDAAAADDTAVRKAIEGVADSDTVCDAILSGLVPVHRVLSPETLERELGDRFFRLRVQNKAQVWVDDDQLQFIPEDSVLGRFVRLMRERLAEADDAGRPILEEALQVGVALLQGREVLA